MVGLFLNPFPSFIKPLSPHQGSPFRAGNPLSWLGGLPIRACGVGRFLPMAGIEPAATRSPITAASASLQMSDTTGPLGPYFPNLYSLLTAPEARSRQFEQDINTGDGGPFDVEIYVVLFQ